MIPITGLYGGLLALLILVLSVLVSVNRARSKVDLGDGGEGALRRAIRVQGNAIEYVPLALILMGIAEVNGLTPMVLHIVGIVLFAARLAHAAGLGRHDGVSAARLVGTAGTWGSLGFLALTVIYQFIVG